MDHWSLLLSMVLDSVDTIQPADVGLKEQAADDDRGFGSFGFNQLSRVARWAKPITYVDIHECDRFTVSFSTIVYIYIYMYIKKTATRMSKVVSAWSVSKLRFVFLLCD